MDPVAEGIVRHKLVPLWYRDFVSCLQATFATVLQHAGHDPVAVLGAAWGFAHCPEQFTPEEFHFPTPDGDLGRALAPHHGLSARWRRAESQDGVEPLAEVLTVGELPVVAVDNFFLPFRPAYHDVHAAHLVVVWGVRAGQVLVSDAMPPAYQGPVALEDFMRSWHSANPADHSDAFFSDSPIQGRWLRIDTTRVDSKLPVCRLHRILQHNVAGMLASRGSSCTMGIEGLRAWLDDLCAAGDNPQAPAFRQAYVLGWAMQARSGLHGELLRTAGMRHELPELMRAGREVERVAHRWTGLRLAAAHASVGDRRARQQIRWHASRLLQAHETATQAMEGALRHPSHKRRTA